MRDELIDTSKQLAESTAEIEKLKKALVKQSEKIAILEVHRNLNSERKLANNTSRTVYHTKV